MLRPARLLAFTLAFVPVTLTFGAEESAQQLADETLGKMPATQEQSAQQLAEQQGTAIVDGKDDEESAQQLATATGDPITPGKDPEESAADLAKQRGENIDPASDPDESAADLAEKRGLEEKPKIDGGIVPPTASGAGLGVNGTIYAMETLPDGSTVVGGEFNEVNGQPRSNLVRFLPDGSVDANWGAGVNLSGAVYALAADAKGGVFVGGYFQTGSGNPPVQNFLRLAPGGTLDPAFGGHDSPNGPVYAVAVHKNGDVVIGGQFSQVGTTPRRNVARFTAGGAVAEPVGGAALTSGKVRSLAPQPDGGTTVGGDFEVEGQDARNLLQTE